MQSARTFIKDTVSKRRERVLIKGWVVARRDHGKLLFLDVKDSTGVAQVVVPLTNDLRFTLPNFAKQNLGGQATNDKKLSDWDVVSIEGMVKERPENLRNPKIETGDIEIEAKKIEVLAQAKTSPIPVEGDGYDISEDTRLKYRYLDLRRDRLQYNLKEREKLIEIVRHFLKERGFTEIETPYLTKSTPEGARDFLVPSRLEPGKFYALPQSPQQYKQLLMLSGIERYFQFPRCFRDEDLRGDRLLEFTQLDIEMAFTFRQEVLELTEALVCEATQALGKRIQEKPFPRLTFAQAMERYGSDKPDTCKDKDDPNLMAYLWITDFPMFEEMEDGSLNTMQHPFTALKEGQRELLSKKISRKELLALISQQYDLVLNGFEVFGGSIREHNPENILKVFEILGHSRERAKEDFGHLFDAFSYGVPPHGGIAAGLDRWLQVLLGEKSIREVVAFPTSGSGKTAVMESPAEVPKEQLEPLGISVNLKRKTKSVKRTFSKTEW